MTLSSSSSRSELSRRGLLGWLAGAAGLSACRKPGGVPEYLDGYAALWAEDPRNANLEWFRNARFGLFVHYGLYSLNGEHPFVQHRQKIPVAEYEKRQQQFTAERFDAGAIADLALEAGMNYVNLVAKHCEGFCLWDTKQTGFNSVKSPAGRDLVAEMAAACRQRRLGLFLFYEHGFDWRHPHGPRFRDFPVRLCEVPYDEPEPFYARGDAYSLRNYVDYVAAQITELLTNYGPVAGIWLDGIVIPLSGDASLFHLPELYGLIHRLQSHALISYKYGVTGAEDFLAPEHQQLPRMKDRRGRPVEICVPLNKGWGWVKGVPHMNADQVMEHLAETSRYDANLLLNIGPLGDGSVDPVDVETLREVGRRRPARPRALPA